MADLKALLSGISKRQMKSDYWLDFDYKEIKFAELYNKKQLACLLCPELEAVDFDILITSLNEILITTMLQPLRTILRVSCSGGFNHGQEQGSVSKKHEYSCLY